MAAGEGLDEAGDVLLVAQRERGQLQPGDPALRPLLQGRNLLTSKAKAHRAAEEVGRLLAGEAEVRGAQLRELAPGAQAGEGQVRVLARRDGDSHPMRQALEEEREGGVDARRIRRVVIVQDEQDVLERAVDLVDDVREDLLGGRRTRSLERGHRVRAAGRLRLMDRGGDVEEEAGGVPVGGVERQPCDAATGASLQVPSPPTR